MPRGDKPQKAPVNYDGFANSQNLIDVWRKRLCFQATPEARRLAEDFKQTLREQEPELSDVLVPNCIYRCGCPEMSDCQAVFWERFEEYAKKHPRYGESNELRNIQVRYDIYNDYFYSIHKEPLSE